MQHDFLLTGMRLPGQCCGMGSMRQEGTGYSTGQVENTFARTLLVAQIVNYDRNAGQAAVRDSMLRLVSNRYCRVANGPCCKQGLPYDGKQPHRCSAALLHPFLQDGKSLQQVQRLVQHVVVIDQGRGLVIIAVIFSLVFRPVR